MLTMNCRQPPASLIIFQTELQQVCYPVSKKLQHVATLHPTTTFNTPRTTTHNGFSTRLREYDGSNNDNQLTYLRYCRTRTSTPRWRRPTQRCKTSSTRRHGASGPVLSLSLRRFVFLLFHTTCVLKDEIELDVAGDDGGKRLLPHQQVFRRSPRCSLLWRQRVDR